MAIRGGMPDMILAVSKGFVDAGMISAPSNLRGMKLGLREFIDSADLGVPYLNSPTQHPPRLHQNPPRHRAARAARLLSRRARNPQRPRRRHENPRQIHPRTRAGNPRRILPHLWPETFAEDHQRRFGRRPAIVETLGKEAASANAASLSMLRWYRNWRRKGCFSRRAGDSSIHPGFHC